MKRYSLFYFIKQSISGLVRNGVMSFASIAVLMSCLIVTGGFSLLVLNIDENLEQFGLIKEIVVYCYKEATDEEIASVGEQINKLNNIETVRYVSSAEGLAKMKADSDVYADVTEEESKLSAAYVITYEDTEKVPELDYQLRQIEGIRKVQNRLDLATSIENFKSGVMLVFLWFLAILMVVSVFIIINTVKLSVFSRRNEISIMRYVGATGWFITLPFIFEGIFIGLLASIAGYFVEWYVYGYIESMVITDLQMISIIQFSDISGVVLAAFIAIGVTTGIIGSSISLGKYLNQ